MEPHARENAGNVDKNAYRITRKNRQGKTSCSLEYERNPVMPSCPEPVFVAILWLLTCATYSLTYGNYFDIFMQYTFVKNKLHTYGINPQAQR